MGMEIERKYLVDEVPVEVSYLREMEIHQTYLAVGDEEVRVRKSTNGVITSHTLTIKTGQGMVRTEKEVGITETTYAQILEGTSKQALVKTRKLTEITSNGKMYLAELDEYRDIDGLKVVEVEFGTIEEANRFNAPAWFKEEVTEDKGYKNQILWTMVQGISNIK